MGNNNKPNILIFMTDHQRGDMAPPFKRALTPNLDAFFNDSVSFSKTYCPAPHCCPSRATFFSGLYPSQHGVWNNVNVSNTLSRGLNDGVRLWSEDLRDAGYELYFTGKWHVSEEESPEERGWQVTKIGEEFVKRAGHRPGPNNNEWDRKYSSLPKARPASERREAEIIRNGFPEYIQYGVDENPLADKEMVDSAINSMLSRESSGAHWCRYVGVQGPHDPYMVPQRFLDMYKLEDIKLPESFNDTLEDKPALYRRTKDRYSQLSEEEHRKSLQHYLAFCTYEDYLFGRVLSALEQTGELDNTVVIYTSDHGDYAAEHGLWAKGLPCFNGAYHIPLLIKWPSVLQEPGRCVDEFVTLADIAPTILDIAGIKVDRRLAGKSLVPFLKGEKVENWRNAVFTQTNGNELYGIQRSVVTKEWKYVYNGFDYDELYNLQQDPHEMRNLAQDPGYDKVIKDMCRAMWDFAYENQDACITPYIMTALAPYGPGVVFEDQPQIG